MPKTVRFDPIDTVIITYSAEEYDRSYFVSAVPVTYSFRPVVSDVTMNTPVLSTTTQPSHHTGRPSIKPLDLSIVPNSHRRALESPIQPEVDSINDKKTKRPKLSINTQSLTPLFFSELSTHYKCKNEDEEEEHGFLIPVMAY
ncbi:hypothetical protein A0J61_06993 [Choanephora cucurbitarum]|uniref:Uncharacterized protein n=1 Tax=Choanephora cucurbitarum TaxID=101091 RepID=A0A1C7N7B1_9FUNG|nr:hypothetical protein A0J61_06993 [Choanephora cucurbitarum]